MDHDAVLALLGLLHPDGFGGRTAVIGPCHGAGRPLGEADLILLAPSAAQWGDLRWRAEVLAGVAGALRTDGVLLAISPRRRDRHSMRSAIRRSGLNVSERVALLPDARQVRHLIPLAPRALQHELVRTAPRLRRAARLAAAVACWSRALESLLPAVGYVVQRERSRQLVAWLTPPHGGGYGDWLVRASWRGRNDPAVVLRLQEASSTPAMVAKVTSHEAAGAEAQMLRAIAAGGTPDGVRTPKLRGLARLGERLALIEEPLEGEPAAVWLAHRPGRLNTLLATLVTWLERWAMTSRQDAVLQRTELEDLVLAPAQRLASLVGDGHAYVDWLTELGECLVGQRLPRTSAHRDLTMWNVMVSRSGGLGILDWAESESSALPLGDVAYSVVDAVSAIDGYRSRQDAFAACFAPDQARPYAVPWVRRLGGRLGLSAQAQTLCVHACWLGHAVDELRHDDDRAGPFVAIVRRLVQQRDLIGSAVTRR